MIINHLRLLRQTSALFILLLNYLCLSESIAGQSIKTVARLAGEIDRKLAILQKNTAPEAASEIASSISEQLDEFDQQSIMIFGDRRRRQQLKLSTRKKP